MLLLACILIGTLFLRMVICWALLELRESLRAAPGMSTEGSVWVIVGTAIWVLMPMSDLADMRANPELQPTAWQIVQVALPAVVTCCILTGLVHFLIHARRRRRQEPPCSID